MTSSTRYTFQLLRAGPLWLDGGSMFGVVPRVIWSKLAPADDRGRIELAHNCLLLSSTDDPAQRVLIETGSGNKFDAKTRDIFGLSEYSIVDAMREAKVDPSSVQNVVVSHLHFDHAGGLVSKDQRSENRGCVLTFPNAAIHVQKREWEDAMLNNSVMTRTYLRENLDPIKERLKLIDSPRPFALGHVPGKDESPRAKTSDRMTEILPGIFTFLVPGHTWGQHAILFTDDRNCKIVFTPDIMPTVNHVGAAYNMAYDVEPFVSTNTRRWFLQSAIENNWTLAIDHEPKTPLVKVAEDGKGWFKLETADERR